MMSLETIRSMSRDAAILAARDNRIPFTVEAEDVRDWKRRTPSHLPFPFLGDYVPQGWKRTEAEQMFVDASGFGRDSEPALTLNRFFGLLVPGKAYAVTEAGQFQVYVAEYERDDTAEGNESDFVGMTSDEEDELEEMIAAEEDYTDSGNRDEGDDDDANPTT